MFRGTFKFDNFYFNYQIEANQVNFSPFSRFELRTPSVHRSVPPNVHLGTVIPLYDYFNKMREKVSSHVHIHIIILIDTLNLFRCFSNLLIKKNECIYIWKKLCVYKKKGSWTGAMILYYVR